MYANASTHFEETTSTLARVFVISGGLAILSLTLVTLIINVKRRLSCLCRLLLTSLCILSISGYSAFLLVHLGLTPRLLVLSSGDQLLFTSQPIEPASTISMGVYRAFCNGLDVVSDKPGVIIWTASIAPNRVFDVEYTLTVENKNVNPIILPLRLTPTDEIHIDMSGERSEVAVFANDKNWNEWLEAGSQQASFEACCAWWPAQSVSSKSIVIEKSDMHRIIIRKEPRSVARDSIKLSIKRSRFQATSCDPIVCDGRLPSSCHLASIEKTNVLEFRLQPGSETSFDVINVLVSCQRKNWAIALLGSALPAATVLLAIVMMRIRQRRRRRREKTEKQLGDGGTGDCVTDFYSSPKGYSPAVPPSSTTNVDFV